MTAQQPQPEHCEHECVCCDYGIVTREDGEPCTIINCINRSRPHIPAPDKIFTSEECNDLCVQAADTAREAATLAETQRIYGLFHEVEMLHLNGMAYPDLYNEMVARIKFIHTEPLSKEGRKKPKQSTAAQEARR
jgi:hypothetical protein